VVPLTNGEGSIVGDANKRGNYAVRVALAREKKNGSPPLRKREDAQEGISNVSYSAIAEYGYELSAADAVLPIILKSENEKELSVIGTGFFVGPDIILTARHIFEGENPRRMACLQMQSASDQYIFRQFRQVIPHEKSDIVLCELHPMKNGRHNLNLLNHVFLIGGAVPSPESALTTYAYPDVSTRRYKDVLHMSIAPHHYDGKVLDVFPVQRDSVMLNFPCMRTSIHLHGGASGGPVINLATGAVVGVNTSSFSGAKNESYVALINPIVDMPIHNVKYVGGISVATTLRELSLSGSARVVPENVLMQAKTITVRRNAVTGA